ncbi:hypothetical protein Tco_0125841, partial [Tanacetum coccineum]
CYKRPLLLFLYPSHCTQSQLLMKYENGQGNDPPLCENNDDPYAIWNNVVTEVESGDNVGGGITNACDRA